MKKSRFILLVAFAFILTFVSCKKADAQSSVSDTGSTAPAKTSGKKSGAAAGYAGTPFNASSYSEETPEYKERTSLLLTTNSSNQVDYDSVNNFFTLDYTPEYPDSVFADSSQNSKNSKKKSSKKSADKTEESESHIPGIRKLSDYVTKYMTKKASLQDYKPNDEAEEDDSSKEFFIEDWGPQEKIVAGENHPTFYVIFSRPARSTRETRRAQLP